MTVELVIEGDFDDLFIPIFQFFQCFTEPPLLQIRSGGETGDVLKQPDEMVQ
jgi:hypothetical protein